jgi:hypothetical protein
MTTVACRSVARVPRRRRYTPRRIYAGANSEPTLVSLLQRAFRFGPTSFQPWRRSRMCESIVQPRREAEAWRANVQRQLAERAEFERTGAVKR